MRRSFLAGNWRLFKGCRNDQAIRLARDADIDSRYTIITPEPEFTRLVFGAEQIRLPMSP